MIQKKGRKSVPHGYRIVKDGMENYILKLLSDTTLSYAEIARKLKKDYNYDISPPTIRDYKKNILLEKTPKEKLKKLQEERQNIANEKEGAKSKIIDVRSDTVDYLRGLSIELNDELGRLIEKERVDALPSRAQAINVIAKNIADIKIKLSEYTKDTERVKLINKVLSDISKEFVGNILPMIDKRFHDASLEQFKKCLEKVSKINFMS